MQWNKATYSASKVTADKVEAALPKVIANIVQAIIKLIRF